MPRETIDMQPTTVRRAAREVSDFTQLSRDIASLGEVRPPSEAEEPILAPSVRRAMYSWLAEIRSADDLRAVGVKPSTTAVLHGAPGCGKTTLAHHLAARLGLPMVLIGAETIVTPYPGESEKKIAELFDVLTKAKQQSVLFIDEIDAIGSKRTEDRGGGATSGRNSQLTVLLRKIEHFTGYCIAATNRPDALDPALWRRFHLQILIDLPGDDERFAIMRRYGAPFVFADEDLDVLTTLTHGASPALLRGIMEGIKRALVINPRIGLPVGDPVAMFAAVTAAVQPPPEMERPVLWEPHGLSSLRDIAWPPAREDAPC